ncbi:hypothetical protein D3C76_1769440 [compost metagenome]
MVQGWPGDRSVEQGIAREGRVHAQGVLDEEKVAGVVGEVAEYHQGTEDPDERCDQDLAEAYQSVSR